MATDWISASEIVAGAAYKHKFAAHESGVLKISTTMLRPELFYPPYNEFIQDLLKENVTPEDVVSSHTNTYQTTKYAVESLNGAGHDINWLAVLEQSAAEYQASQYFRKLADKLEKGKHVDWTDVHSIIARTQLHEGAEMFVPVSKIDRNEVPFTKTGYFPIDKHFLGIPAVGMTVLFGPRKSGKTSLCLQIAGSFVREHPNKSVAFFSMEMMKNFLVTRLDQVCNLTEEEESRILIRDYIESPEDVVSRIAVLEDVGLAIIDFADLMIEGETTESAMGNVYRTVSKGAKKLKIPIILLAHPNKSYQGGIPRPEQIRWTGLASNLSEMILAAYNPAQNLSYSYDRSDDKLLRPIPGMIYLVAWEVRAGFRVHEDDSPGAIAIPWNGKRGWHPKKGKWFQIKE